MKLNIKLLSVFAVLYVNITIAQFTVIPDQNFEQALIDLGIDSDGVVNGQVLTADIENIVELDFSNQYINFTYGVITDFSGIEDFIALEILNISNLDISLDESQIDVFNSNFFLKEFIADDFSYDTNPFIDILYLNFSNLDNLEYISLVTSGEIYSINLDNPNTSYENLSINLSHEYWDPPSTYTVCINVNDPQAAASNQFPYNTWNIISPDPDENAYVWRDYSFSSTCTLSTSEFDLNNSISIYPNPVNDKLWFENLDKIKIVKAEIYTISGQKMNSFPYPNHFIDVKNLETGIYILKIYNLKSYSTYKILKK